MTTPEAVCCAGDDAVAARLAALQRLGVPQRDPLRWYRVQALAHRLPQASADVQALLQNQLHHLIESLAASRPATAPLPAPRTAQPASLAGLTERLAAWARHKSQAVGQGALSLGEAPPAHDLPSVRRLRQASARRAADRAMASALARAPAHAGPLNSHALVLRSLALMQQLSPAYARRFVVYAETLTWLEAASPRAPSKVPRRKSDKK